MWPGAVRASRSRDTRRPQRWRARAPWQPNGPDSASCMRNHDTIDFCVHARASPRPSKRVTRRSASDAQRPRSRSGTEIDLRDPQGGLGVPGRKLVVDMTSALDRRLELLRWRRRSAPDSVNAEPNATPSATAPGRRRGGDRLPVRGHSPPRPCPLAGRLGGPRRRGAGMLACRSARCARHGVRAPFGADGIARGGTR